VDALTSACSNYSFKFCQQPLVDALTFACSNYSFKFCQQPLVALWLWRFDFCLFKLQF